MPAHAGVLAPCGADWHSYAPVVGGGGDGSSRGLLSGGHDREGGPVTGDFILTRGQDPGQSFCNGDWDAQEQVGAGTQDNTLLWFYDLTGGSCNPQTQLRAMET